MIVGVVCAGRGSPPGAYFRARPDELGGAPPSSRTSSDRMMAAGIVQAGHPTLAAVAEPFDLPGLAARSCPFSRSLEGRVDG